MKQEKSIYAQRREKVQKELKTLSFDAAVVNPGRNFFYLTGYKAIALERLTALIITPNDSWVIMPTLEVEQFKDEVDAVECVAWDETDNPYELISKRLNKPNRILLDEKMPFHHVLALQNHLPAEYLNFSQIIGNLRATKTAYEIEQLKEVSNSINRIHASLNTIVFKGKSEKSVAREIHDLILQNHESVDFVIVASGINSANPHHVPGDKIIDSKDVVVIDIGGTSNTGYCSDCTRTYVIDEIDPEFQKQFAILQKAQEKATLSVKAGDIASQVDASVRDDLSKAGLDKWFIHRLGHGIGLETHEEPYLVANNHTPLRVGNAFSIEPGFYIPKKWGARIEDIVAIDKEGTINFNDFNHDLQVLH